MKKTVIGLLLTLAIIVVVSPGIIGKLAEHQIDENLKLVANPDNGVVISSLSFDRGWFSSAGQHRLELSDSEIAATLGISGAAPALIIDTRFDHGLIPFASIRRERGSLAPGLGSAVSTLALDPGDGELIELPGAVYSRIGIIGDLWTSFALPAGEHSISGGMVRWEPGQLTFASDADAHHFVISGDMAGSTVLNTGDQRFPGFGEVALRVDIAFSGLNAAALGGVAAQLDKLDARVGPEQFLAIAEYDLQRLFASGFHLDFKQFDLTLPAGEISVSMCVDVPETEATTFKWSGLLPILAASLDVEVPAELIDMAQQANPELGIAIGLGYLKKKGNFYAVNARLAQGLLTVNGAPAQLPQGAFR